MNMPVLVVHNDPIVRKSLRQALEHAGYDVMEAGDTESGLAALRMNERGMLVIFNLILLNYTITGTDGIAFLGEAASARDRGIDHAFVIVTPTPEPLEVALGRLIHRLAIPVVAEPPATDALLDAIATAGHRFLISA